ncbi:MAG TPA: endopeptidase La [Candidatus Polarisedimenticolia bacterium]|nr:endopeptidase La [Candidatus Polarisedimenticolia bacterium]
MTAARTDAPEGGEARVPKELPVLPLRDLVVYPFIIVPLSVSRERSIKAVEKALSDNRMILLVAQKESDTEEPGEKDLHTVGTVGVIMRMLKLPDSRIRVLVQGVCRARVEGYQKKEPYLEAKIQRIHEPPAEGSLEVEALLRSTKKALERAVSLGKAISSEVMVIAGNLEEPGRLADLVASNLDLKVEDAQGLLKVIDPLQRLRRTYELLNREIELLNMQQEINTHAREEIDKSQREYFLRQQLKAIQSELGEGNDLSEEVEAFREKTKKARMPKKVNDEVERQIGKLERMHPDSAETATLRNYLDWMVNLPWSTQTKDTLDLKKAQEILDADHYGLEGIKERIVEYLAVRKLKKKMRGPILCFVGPPGVGKTSLGRSIARALGRKFVRISLGGVRDEAEIRGHRRTYVGSMPGRIIQGISQAGSNNPVFMLDEVDKIGADYRGDPSAALLEVLDPEQNNSFRDHYLNVPFDLSNVMFVATANLLDPIQPAFRDRMEVITLSGYTEEEKVEIAKRHLIPKQIEENGLRPDQLALPDRSIQTVIQKYTREAGLRNLEREFAKMFRKLARRVAEGETGPFNVTPKTAEGLLGVPRVTPEMTLQRDQVGVATGLAWTAAGGEILFVEATTMPGRGRLILTGHLGAVMKESAQAALSYARSRAAEFGLNTNAFGELDVHVHVPEGAIPKDGPSAGITMATAILSVLTGRPVRRHIAMTGEITLRGNVLPIGGVKEKVLAARRAEASTVILPEGNRRNLEDVPKLFRKGLRFVFVSDVNQVLAEALGEPIARPRAPRVAAGRSVAAL